jgi:hypothetical protein
MRPALLVATALSGIVVAIGFIVMMQTRPAPTDAPEPGNTVTGRPSAFHVGASPEEKKRILETTFPRIASERPERLGDLKDNIALVLDNPAAIQWVVAQWQVHKNEGKYSDAAFLDIFRLVKDPAFVGPVAALLESPLPAIRAKAIQSAQTQASPALGGRILAFYRNVEQFPGARKGEVRKEALDAGATCRGDAWPALLQEAILGDDAELAVRALMLATDQDVPGLEGTARTALASSKDRRVKLFAAALLLKRGDPSAAEEVLRDLDPADPGTAADAVHLVTKYRFMAAAGRLRELRPKATGELKPLFTLALLRTGDQNVMNEVIQAADAEGSPGEIEALQLLAASGDENTLPILLHAVGRGGIERVHAIARGITTSGEKGFLPVVEKLIEAPVSHPAELGEAPFVAGPALTPRLAKLLREATDPQAQVRIMAWLAQVGGTAARDAIIAERDRIGRLAEEQIRLIDLEARRLGTPAPPLHLQ